MGIRESTLFFDSIAGAAQRGLDSIGMMADYNRTEPSSGELSIVRYTQGDARKLPFMAAIHRTIRSMEAEGVTFERDMTNLTKPYQLTIGDLRRIYEWQGQPSFSSESRSGKAKLVGVVNLKGGTGKTTAVANIAVGLIHSRKHISRRLRVLLLDLDPQGSLTYMMGVKANPSRTTLQAIAQNPSREELLEWIVPTSNDGLYILPAETTDAFLTMAHSSLARERNVPLSALLETSIIDKIADQFDLIITDSCPHLDSSLINVLASANGLLVPVAADRLDLDSSLKFMRGLSSLFNTLHNSRMVPETFRILLTRFDESNNDHIQVKDLLDRDMPQHLLDTPMMFGRAFANSQTRQGTLYDIPLRDYRGNKKGLGRAKECMDKVVSDFFSVYLLPECQK